MSDDGSRAPGRALLAAALAVLAVILAWQFRFGPWAMVLIPVFAMWVANVHLGGGWNEPVHHVFGRLQRRQAGR